jgi:hypothetical protein
MGAEFIQIINSKPETLNRGLKQAFLIKKKERKFYCETTPAPTNSST